MSVESLLGARPCAVVEIQVRSCSGLDGGQDGGEGHRFGEVLSLVHKNILVIFELASCSWASCVWVWKVRTCYFRGGELIYRGP